MHSLLQKARPSVTIGIDPGTRKCGIAVVGVDGEPILLRIVARDSLVSALSPILADYNVTLVAVGNRTGSEAVLRELDGNLCGASVVAVEEARSTRDGVALLLKSKHPWTRWLFVLGLATGAVKADSWAALEIARRTYYHIPGADLRRLP